MSLDERLRGARIQRVDAPFTDLFAFSVHGRAAHGVLVLGLSPQGRGVGFGDKRPRGEPAGGLVSKLRKHVEGARIESLAQPQPGLLVLQLSRGGRDGALVAHFFGRGNLLLLDEQKRVVLSLRRLEPGRDPLAAPENARALPLDEDAAALAARAEQLARRAQGGGFAQEKRELLRTVQRRERGLGRRLEAIERDRDRAAEVAGLRRDAGLLLTHLHELAPDAVSVELWDESLEPPQPRALELDPALGPRRQAEAWFTRARKLERGAHIAAERAAVTQRELAEVTQLRAVVEAAQDSDALSAARARAHALGLSAVSAPAQRSARASQRLPYRQFVGSGGRPILVGRGPADNDRLTLDKARPQDLWLHVRDHGGAHVVVPLQRDEACPSELLCDAATLAAHFSQAKGQQVVDVLYTQRRYIRKPRKTAPGRVLVEREKVFRLRLEPARLARLLEAEQRSLK